MTKRARVCAIRPKQTGSKNFVRAGTKAAAYIASKPGKSLIPHAGTSFSWLERCHRHQGPQEPFECLHSPFLLAKTPKATNLVRVTNVTDLSTCYSFKRHFGSWRRTRVAHVPKRRPLRSGKRFGRAACFLKPGVSSEISSLTASEPRHSAAPAVHWGFMQLFRTAIRRLRSVPWLARPRT
jgi:hypothetical protein